MSRDSGQNPQNSRKRPLEGSSKPHSKHIKLKNQGPKSVSDAISLLKSCVNSIVISPSRNDEFSSGESSGDEFSGDTRPLIFTVSGSVESFPNQPLINISGFGILPLPVTGVLFQELAKHFDHDRSSNSIFIDVSMLSFGDASFENKVDVLQKKHIFRKVGCFSFLRQSCLSTGLTIRGPHTDTRVHKPLYLNDYSCINGDMFQFGTLCIQLPSVYSGGKMKVEHEVEKCSLSFDPSLNQQSCFYYSGIGAATVSEASITAGYKVTLDYSLYAAGGIDKRLHPTIKQKISIGSYLKYLCEKDKSVFWPLNSIFRGKVNDILKFNNSVDKHLVNSILEGISYSDFGQVEVYLASLRKTVIEKGECLENGRVLLAEMMGQAKPDISKENCFLVDKNHSIEISYKICDFKPLTQSTPSAKSLTIDGLSIEYVEQFAAIKDWGPVVDVGCSGHSPFNPDKEIALYESYQQKDVIVVLSITRSFSYKLEKSIECAMEYLEGADVSLLKEEQLREMEKSVIVKLRNKLSRASCGIKYRMISLCIRNKSWLSCLDMIRICSRKNNAGIPIKEDMKFAYKIIAKVVDIFGWERAEKPVMLLFKKCQAYQCKEVIKCANLIPQADKEKVFDFLIEKITVNSDHFNNFYWFFHNIFSFGISSTQNVPESVWTNLTDCTDFLYHKRLTNCLQRYGHKVDDKILSICYDQVDDYDIWELSFEKFNGSISEEDCDDRGMPFDSENIDPCFVNNVLTYCIEKGKTEMLSKFADLAKEYWEYEENSCHLVAFVIKMYTDEYNLDQLDQSLASLVQQRMNFLKVVTEKGMPPFSWCQPEVNQPKDDSFGMVDFLHSPEEVYNFHLDSPAQFLKIFDEKHAHWDGLYSLKITGSEIEVTKTKKVWERDVELYKNKLAEYEEIVQFVETSGIIFP